MFNHFFFENHAIYEIMWKKHCRIDKATNDNVVHVIIFLDYVNTA